VPGTLIEFIEMQLPHGYQVHINFLRTFCPTLISEGQDTPDALPSERISGAGIRFRPGKRLKKLAKNLDYFKVSMNVNGQAS
jgi:hypothetical protein